jgi:CheY-like chemotaxis protein
MQKLLGRRIFIFEDNVGNRAVMQTLLGREGAVVAFDRWGQDYQEKLEKFLPIDIILLDLMYPNNVSGFDIYDHICSLPAFATIPIVAVSAADAQTAMRKAQEKGFAGFISKPIDLRTFPEQMNCVLEGHPVWAGS